MSRGLRSTCSVYEDAGIYYDDNRMFYVGDVFDRGDAVTAYATSDNTHTSLSADKAVNGTISANMCSFDNLCDAVSTVADSSVSVSSSFDELAARISALEMAVNKEMNDCKNSFLNTAICIKRLTRTGLKTLQYGAR